MTYRKKLIEVALPLEAINAESAREKTIRQGHPSTLHLWWARRPLAACRAVLFSSLVDDPSEYCPDEASANAERERLFDLIEDLVLWDNINNEDVLDRAKLEIARSVARELGVEVPVGIAAIREFLATQAPPVFDPFAGGGSIPLEAQRLGLRAYASDLNPVAVLINKALIEIPPKFAGMLPVHLPEERGASGKKNKKVSQAELWKKEWKGAEGLAEDVRYYGKWMRDEAYKRIGHLYPPVTITAELLVERPDLKAQGIKIGDKLTVIAWLWARTVKCPNPACGARMVLLKTLQLCTKRGKMTWLEPRVERGSYPSTVKFSIKAGSGAPLDSPKVGRGAQFRCIACGQIAPEESIRAEFKAKRNNTQLLAVVVEGNRKRLYISPDEEQIQSANAAKPVWIPEEEMNTETPNLVSGRGYGITHWSEISTTRQLAALSTFSDLVSDVQKRILQDIQTKRVNLAEVIPYSEAIITYLGMAVSRQANRMSTICFWDNDGENVQQMFARQAIPMTWDFAEANPFCYSTGSWMNNFDYICGNLERLPSNAVIGRVQQKDAQERISTGNLVICTDPPYYDNVPYAELSDYFYIWLRRSLGKIYPEIFATLMVPKADELVATPYRFKGDKKKAKNFFESGLRQVFRNVSDAAHNDYPVTVFYAFRQSETGQDERISIQSIMRSSTGWETMLEGLLSSSFQITGTWPMRTEQPTGLRVINQNSLASSIVLVCRRIQVNASSIIRREFLTILRKDLPRSLKLLQQGSVAPVDFTQAAIGPGMAIFSQYTAVLESDGSPMRVCTALTLINQALDEFLAEQEGEYDGDTRWALAWYEQYGHEQGPYGVAETLSKAKNTSVEGAVEAGILEARAGKVRLLRREELDPAWDPQKDKRPTAWEACQHLIYALDTGGEDTAAALQAKMGALGETARDLAYRLYTICERKGWAQDALGYNMLVVAWPRLKELARGKAQSEQARLL